MQDFIVSETTKIFNKAIKKFSKEDKIGLEEVSILLYLKEDGDNKEAGYKVCHYHQPVRETKIMEILGVRIDLKGYSIIVPPQIKKILENFEIELGSKNIEVCVYLNREEESEVRYFLYNDGTLIKEFLLENVLKFELA